MSVRLSLAAAAAAMALVAGCAHADRKVPRAEHPVAFLPTLTRTQTRGLTSVAWEPVDSAGPGDALVVRVPDATCPQLRGAVVTDTSDQVTVQIFATVTRCSEDGAGYVVAPVRLPSPLGNRQLRHGPVSRPLPAIGNGPPARRPQARR